MARSLDSDSERLEHGLLQLSALVEPLLAGSSSHRLSLTHRSAVTNTRKRQLYIIIPITSVAETDVHLSWLHRQTVVGCADTSFSPLASANTV